MVAFLKVGKNRIEFLFVLGFFGIFLCVLGPPFLTGAVTASHDNVYWNFPLFHFFAEALHNGELPLWNPYTHGGEPFYPILGQMRLFDPPTILSVLIGQVFTKNITALFNWQRIFQLFITFTGTYVLIRRSSDLLPIRLFLAVVILFSSMTLSTFRSDGIIHQYLWAPWVLFFLIRIFVDKDTRPKNFIALAVILGVNYQTYFFIGPWLLVTCFILYVSSLDRESFVKILTHNKKWVGAFVVIQVLMATPLIVTYFDRVNLVFPNRTIPHDFLSKEKNDGSYITEGSPREIPKTIGMSFKALEYSGTFLKPGDLLQFFRPDGYDFLPESVTGVPSWGETSDVYLYIGLVPLLLSFLGLFWGKHPLKPLYLGMMIFFGLFAFGPRGGVYSVLFFLSPLFQVIRNGGYLSLYFQLGLLFLVGLGADFAWHVQPKIQLRSSRATFWLFMAGVLTTTLGLVALIRMPYPLDRYSIFLVGLLLLQFFYLRKWTSWGTIFYIVFLSTLLNVFLAYPDKPYFLIFLTSGLLCPILLYVLWKQLGNSRFTPFFLTSLFILVFMDLGFHTLQVSTLFRKVSPSKFFDVNPNLTKQPALGRMVSAFYSPNWDGKRSQGLRYPEVLHRQAAMLSAPRGGYDETQNFEKLLPKPRWDYYILSSRLHSLIYAPLEVSTLRQLLGIDNNYFEFRKNAVQVTEEPWLSFSNDWAQNLKETVLYSGALPLTPEHNSTVLNNAKFEHRFIRYKRNAISTLVEMPEEGYILWRNGFDPYWKLKVDEKPWPLFRANFHQTALSLPKGRYRLEFTYEPLLFLAATGIFLLCFLLGGMFYLYESGIKEIKILVPQKEPLVN